MIPMLIAAGIGLLIVGLAGGWFIARKAPSAEDIELNAMRKVSARMVSRMQPADPVSAAEAAARRRATIEAIQANVAKLTP